MALFSRCKCKRRKFLAAEWIRTIPTKFKCRGLSFDGLWMYGLLGIGMEENEKGELDDKYYICCPNPCEVFPFTVCRPIERVDKFGKQIYEGDIVKCPLPEDAEHYLFLKENTKDYVFREIRIPKTYQEGLTDDCVIIGNIYSNPELLEEVKK